MRFGQKLDNALPGTILEIIEVTTMKQVWLGGTCNVISVFSPECSSPDHINFGRGYSAVQSMIYVKETNRVWVATADVILSICAEVRLASVCRLLQDTHLPSLLSRNIPSKAR